MSIAERKLWTALRGRRFEGLKFRRQHPIGRFIVDLACVDSKVVIEADGESHDVTVDEDAERTRLLNSLGYRVIRFKNEDVLFRFEQVLNEVFDVCVKQKGDDERDSRP